MVGTPQGVATGNPSLSATCPLPRCSSSWWMWLGMVLMSCPSSA